MLDTSNSMDNGLYVRQIEYETGTDKYSVFIALGQRGTTPKSHEVDRNVESHRTLMDAVLRTMRIQNK